MYSNNTQSESGLEELKKGAKTEFRQTKIRMNNLVRAFGTP